MGEEGKHYKGGTAGFLKSKSRLKQKSGTAVGWSRVKHETKDKLSDGHPATDQREVKKTDYHLITSQFSFHTKYFHGEKRVQDSRERGEGKISKNKGWSRRKTLTQAGRMLLHSVKTFPKLSIATLGRLMKSGGLGGWNRQKRGGGGRLRKTNRSHGRITERNTGGNVLQDDQPSTM